jgi:hypothetical protein
MNWAERAEFQPLENAQSPRRTDPDGRFDGGVSSTDLAEGLLSAAFVDADIELGAVAWNRLCKAFVRQCRRRGLFS